MLMARYSTLAPFVMQALCKVIVIIGKAQWPYEWPSFLSDILALIVPSPSNPTQMSESALPALHLLSLVVEEFPLTTARSVLSLPTQRTNAIKHALSASLLEILSTRRERGTAIQAAIAAH